MLARLNHSRLLRYAGLFTWAAVGLWLLNIWFDPTILQPESGGPPFLLVMRWLTAYLALLDGRHAEGANILDDMGSVPHAALARTEAAERLVQAGRYVEADALLSQALVFWRSVRADRFISRAEALLSKSA